ncbi:hypothetical protein BDV32DRAFT_123458 [Aspergillus pseudonomiae]|nr:hypothetical protein BDV32DRAFT_123458 [Aspergillus pseudonomiae]
MPPLRASTYCATKNNDSHYYCRQGCIDKARRVKYQESYSSPALWRWLGSLPYDVCGSALCLVPRRLGGPNRPKGANVMLSVSLHGLIFCSAT